jgi:hypothetical protein
LKIERLFGKKSIGESFHIAENLLKKIKFESPCAKAQKYECKKCINSLKLKRSKISETKFENLNQVYNKAQKLVSLEVKRFHRRSFSENRWCINDKT